MTIIEYLKLTGQTMAGLGAKLGVTHTTISRWAHGQREPSFEMVERLFEVSGGRITIDSFMSFSYRNRKYGRKRKLRPPGGNAGLTVGKA